MKDVLRRALRDDEGTVFPTDLLGDFIVEAMADLSLIRPIEYFLSAPFDPLNPLGIDPADYDLFTYIWQLEFRVNRDDELSMVIPFATDEGPYRNGWGWFMGRVTITQWWHNRLSELVAHYPDDGVLVSLFGYRDHKMPVDDSSVLDFVDSIDHLLVVRHIKSLAYQSLEADRSLYQQWLAATNNTDVSPTQLQGMRNQAESSYERLRKQASRSKRVPTTGIQYVS